MIDLIGFAIGVAAVLNVVVVASASFEVAASEYRSSSNKRKLCSIIRSLNSPSGPIRK